MTGRILLLRHGRIEQSVPRRFVGQMNLPLDRTGREQAEAVRARLEKAPLARVVASDLDRTLETAAIVSEGRGVAVEAEPALREISLGAWEGLSVREVRERFSGAYERRGREMATERPEGGESFQDLEARVWPVFERIANEAREREEPTLVVAHAGVNRVLLCRILGLPLAHLFRLHQDYCGLNVIEHTAEGFVLRGMNLPSGEELP